MDQIDEVLALWGKIEADEEFEGYVFGVATYCPFPAVKLPDGTVWVTELYLN